MNAPNVDVNGRQILKKAANAKHGLALTKGERNEQIRLLRVEDKRSQEEIAKIFKIGQPRIAQILKSEGVLETNIYSDLVIKEFINGESNATTICGVVRYGLFFKGEIMEYTIKVLRFNEKIKDITIRDVYGKLSEMQKAVYELIADPTIEIVLISKKKKKVKK